MLHIHAFIHIYTPTAEAAMQGANMLIWSVVQTHCNLTVAEWHLDRLRHDCDVTTMF